jgi:hypothetical protein
LIRWCTWATVFGLHACRSSDPIPDAISSADTRASAPEVSADPPPSNSRRVHRAPHTTRAEWSRRLETSRGTPEDRIPTLVEALEDQDAFVRAQALGEIEREPRAVAAALLLPIVESDRDRPEAVRAAGALVGHFRAFDFPDDEPDPLDERIFRAIARATVESAAPERTAFVAILARMFRIAPASGGERDDTGHARAIAQRFVSRLGDPGASELNRSLEAQADDVRARRLMKLFVR